MSKIAVVTDSNSGITQAQAKACGVTVLPMPFYVKAGDIIYAVGVPLNAEIGSMNIRKSISIVVTENE